MLRTNLLLIATLAVSAQLASAQTNAAPPSPPPGPARADVPWGITTSASSSGNCAQWFPKMHDVGIRWARMFPEWSSIENPKGTFHWDTPDAMVSSAAADDIEMSGLLFGNAPGAPGGMHAFPMNHLDDWSSYAAALADRYKGKIHFWEVWNEGNAGFNDGHNNTADYANLVAAAYEGVKKSDPTAQVGMSVASFDPAYIDQAIVDQNQNGKKGDFDYLCIHPYETFGGVGNPGGEVPYLWMTRLLRDELKADAPDKINVPIWITEVGRPVGKSTNDAGLPLGMTPDEFDAAKAVIKAYIMADAQGIAHICWFEAQDPEREQQGYGLIDVHGKPRPSYTAMKSMTSALGETPKYLGWLAVGPGGKGYGFVFQGPHGHVLVAWNPVGTPDSKITFNGNVQVLDPLTGVVAKLGIGDSLMLTNTPTFIIGLPTDLFGQVQSNTGKNFPWGGDYSKATTVTSVLGSDTGYGGVYCNNSDLQAHTFDDDHSTGLVVPGDINHAVSFTVHPSFANIRQNEYYIRLSFRRLTAGNDGMNFKYEVADSEGKGPLRNSGGWYSMSNDMGWQTKVYHVTDACFAKMWDFDFSINPEQSVPFVVGKVEVSTQPFNP